MATQPHHDPHRPLLDPMQFEQAGRVLKLWLDRLLGHADTPDETEIEWEDGEPKNARHDGISPGH